MQNLWAKHNVDIITK